MPYRIEQSPNNRAVCKDKRCKEAGDKITKGELRFATFVEIAGNQSWAYKHWGCVTPQQLENLKKYMEGQWELLEGLDDLPDDIQTKVRGAVEQGHVDDEDWKWDPEVNRPGSKRIHKKKPSADVGDNEDAANENVEKTVKKAKAKSKKRSRAADEDDEEEAEQPSPPKKKKAAAKSKVKDESEDPQPKANEKKARKPKAKTVKEETNIKDEEDDVEEEVKPQPKNRSSAKSKASAPAEDEKPKPPQKSKVKATKADTVEKGAKKGKSTKVDAAEKEAKTDKPAAKRGRKKT